MGTSIRITAGDLQLEARLNDTQTAELINQALPITAVANTWGDEIYFAIPVSAELEEGQEVVELGDLGYWPPGKAFCIFFGPTPASAVTVIGKVEGDVTTLRQVGAGTPVIIELAT